MSSLVVGRVLLAAMSFCVAIPALADEMPSAVDCAHQIHRAVDMGEAEDVATSCWHIGPVALDMSRSEVERALGSPDYYASAPSRPAIPRYAISYYVFPRDLSERLAKRPTREFAHRILELRYVDDKVVRISDNPPEATWSPRCGGPQDGAADQHEKGDDSVRDFAPLEVFATAKVGDDLRSVTHKFGKKYSWNSSRDFYNYWPIPVTFDVDPDTSLVTGFALEWPNRKYPDTGKDPAFGWPHFFVAVDPVTCLKNGYKLLPNGPSD